MQWVAVCSQSCHHHYLILDPGSEGRRGSDTGKSQVTGGRRIQGGSCVTLDKFWHLWASASCFLKWM